MRTRIFQVDAFTTRRFAGNPAAVMPLEQFLDPALMQAIAAENNLAEAAFIVPQGRDYRIRWFTPLNEVPLLEFARVVTRRTIGFDAAAPRIARGGCRTVSDEHAGESFAAGRRKPALEFPVLDLLHVTLRPPLRRTVSVRTQEQPVGCDSVASQSGGSNRFHIR